MANLSNHPGYWLEDGAAASFERMEAERGRPFSISDAGRTCAEQTVLINRWNAGGTYNRPPYLYKPASCDVSPHVKNGGQAVDVDNANDRAWIAANGRKHGWRFNIADDPVHMIYESWNDQFRGQESGGGSGVAAQQAFLNAHRGESLAVDGVAGPLTTSAIARYQQFLKDNFGYNAGIDGIWGPGTQAAHEAYWASIQKPPASSIGSVPDGLPWMGIQKMLKALYGYAGAIDNIPGDGTIRAFQRFLRANNYQPGEVDGIWGPNTAMAAQRWLRARWGYGGAIDADYGPGTRAAWARADAENGAAF